MISTFFGRKFHFYSRPREGGDVVAMLWKYWYWISIHAPAKGATMNLFNLMFHFRISIHAPAKGATRKVIGCTVIFGISIHAPAKGATKGLFISSLNIGISIHAPAKGATAHFYNFYFHMRSTFVYHAQCNKFTIYISNIKYSYIVRNYCAVPPHFHVRQTYAQLFITTKVLPLQCFFSFQKYQSYFYKNSLIDKI